MTHSNAGTAKPDSGEKVGFISLGCPKALVDSERILTQLRIVRTPMSTIFGSHEQR